VPTKAELGADTIDIKGVTAPFAGFLRLPNAGFRAGKTGKLDAIVGSHIRMWTRSFQNNSFAVYLKFNSGSAAFDESNRADGFSVRCIKD
jgi:uncharacterized protein (TIGR02145 family)